MIFTQYQAKEGPEKAMIYNSLGEIQNHQEKREGWDTSPRSFHWLLAELLLCSTYKMGTTVEHYNITMEYELAI